ncbi:50S ribosomal protein L24 [bacterium SM23_31]|nr:MAG: 50S ribosomal protein L24 [bacterium SM23_31]
MNVIKNDNVLVIAGNEKGRQGRVLKTYPKTQRILVEGINFIKRHSRPSQQNPQGGIVEKEGTINVSNVMVICPKCSNATRIKRRILENGKSVRICRNCLEMLTVSG